MDDWGSFFAGVATVVGIQFSLAALFVGWLAVKQPRINPRKNRFDRLL